MGTSEELQVQEQITVCGHDDDIKESTKDILENQFKLENIKVISCGVYSHVLAAEKNNSRIAVKMIPRRRRTDGITKIWPYVRHKNILTVLCMEFVADLDAIIVLSPLHVCNLEYMLKLDKFLKNDTAVQIILNWIREITSALNYLHKRKLCHLGLRSQNILISSDNSAVICDFRVAEVSIIPADVHDVMPCDMSPEMIERLNIFPRIHIEGIPFDVWCLGMLTLNIFTSNYVQQKCIDEAPFWHKIYPFIFKVIEPTYFNSYMKVVLPACNVSDELAGTIRNFITACLIIRPDERYSSEQLLKHRLLKKKGFLHEPDDLWEQLVPSHTIQSIVHSYLPKKSCVALPAITSSNIYNKSQLCCHLNFPQTSGVSDENITVKSDSALTVKKTCREKHETFIENMEEEEEKFRRTRCILPLLDTVPEVDLGLPVKRKNRSVSATNLSDIDLVFARAFNRLDTCFKDLFEDPLEASSSKDIQYLLKDATVIDECTIPEHEDQCPLRSYDINDLYAKLETSENYAEMILGNARATKDPHETISLPVPLEDEEKDADAFSIFLASKDGEKYREKIFEDLQKLHPLKVEDVTHEDPKATRSEECLPSKALLKQPASESLVLQLALETSKNEFVKNDVNKNQPEQCIEDASEESASGSEDKGIHSQLPHPAEEHNNGQKSKNKKCHVS